MSSGDYWFLTVLEPRDCFLEISEVGAHGKGFSCHVGKVRDDSGEGLGVQVETGGEASSFSGYYDAGDVRVVSDSAEDGGEFLPFRVDPGVDRGTVEGEE